MAGMFSQAADRDKKTRAAAAEERENKVIGKQKNNTAKEGGVKYSIADSIVDDNGNLYNNVVVLDTNIFDGTKTRNWGKVLNEFVYNNLAGKKITVYDENDFETVIEFAKSNERAKKDGANNSHKVLDKLVRKKDLNSQLAVAHSDELIYVSQVLPTEDDERNHQWLDEKGWTHREAILMKRNGDILSANLNIANTLDGRKILYDINKITVIGHGAVPSDSKKSRGSHINTNNGKSIVPPSTKNVNTPKSKNDLSSDIRYAVDDDLTEQQERKS